LFSHQVIGLANGISTYKMFNGHRGINHPVKNLISGKGEIISESWFCSQQGRIRKQVIWKLRMSFK
jgi:carbamoylphosphate synthase small subunit